MHELLAGAASERLDLDSYQAEFEDRFWETGPPGFWKLERRQHFREPGFDSWEAFTHGDAAESLRLLAAGRPAMFAEHQRMREHGIVVRRVRVVEEPLVPYLRWELRVLALREECGTGVRVVGPDQIVRHELAGPLPEICTLGAAVMYEVIYDERGTLDGARRYTDPDLILRWQRLIADLYATGEPLADYLRRRAAAVALPPVEQLADVTD